MVRKLNGVVVEERLGGWRFGGIICDERRETRSKATRDEEQNDTR